MSTNGAPRRGLQTALVMSGVPASGKTTLGRKLAAYLGVAFLDKDDFLEKLYDERGIGDLSWRHALSRESDSHFENAAKKHNSVVLVSHWRSPNSQGTSGTPTQWLHSAFTDILEVYCKCQTDLAVSRFLNRTRHTGHCDDSRHRDSIADNIHAYAQELPLGIGRLITVDTNSTYDVHKVAKDLGFP